MKKALYSLIMVMILLLGLNGPVYGLEPLALHVEGYEVKSNVMDIFINTNLAVPPAPDRLTVSLGNTLLPIKEIKEFSASDQGTSLIFLIDVSGSINTNKLQHIKDTLNTMADNLSTSDNFSILTVGNEAYTQPFITDKQQMKDQISSIQGKSEDTNLYASIVKALEILSTNESCRPKKCLVILSDGEDYGEKGITREEVNKKTEKLRIPIYTVALLGENPQERYIQTSKILGSFSRLSPGGIDYVHKLTEDSSTQIAADIKSSLNKGLIVSADLSGFQSEGNEMYFKVELVVEGQGKASDGYSIATGGLSSSAPAKKSSPVILRLVVGACAIILAAIFLIVLKKRKKAASFPAPDLEITPASASEDNQSGGQSEAESKGAIAQPGPEILYTPAITIRLTKVGLSEEEIFVSEIQGELVIGRDPLKSALPFPKDDLLSARHCVIRNDSGTLILQDLGSTNGTFVNGVPIYRPYKLENDDIMLIGSMKLRLNW